MHSLCVHVCLCRVAAVYMLLIHVDATSPEIIKTTRTSMKSQFYLRIWGIRVCFFQRTHSCNMSSFNLAQQGFAFSALPFLKKLGPRRAALTHHGGACRWLESKTPKHYHHFVWFLILPDFHSVYTTASVSQVWDTHLHMAQGHRGSGAGLKVEASSEQTDGESHFLPCTRAHKLHNTVGMQTHT